MGKQMTFNAKKGTNIYIFFRPFGEKTRRKLPVVVERKKVQEVIRNKNTQ